MQTKFGTDFWAWNLGGLKPWRDKTEKFAGKIRWEVPLINLPAILLKLAKPK